MQQVHKPLPSKYFEKPDSVTERTVCQRTGMSPDTGCPTVYQAADKTRSKTLCKGNHGYIGTKPYMEIPGEEEEGTEGETEPAEGGEAGEAGTEASPPTQ